MVGMPGLEPGNPEGADLQSAAVAAVPHPHSVFKHLWESSTPQAEMNNKRLPKTCQRKPRRRAYSCHKTYTRGGRGMLPSPLSFAFGSAARFARESRGGQHPPASCVVLLAKPCLGCRSTCYAGCCVSPDGETQLAGSDSPYYENAPLRGRLAILEPVMGIEPITTGLQGRCSTIEPHWRGCIS